MLKKSLVYKVSGVVIVILIVLTAGLTFNTVNIARTLIEENEEQTLEFIDERIDRSIEQQTMQLEIILDAILNDENIVEAFAEEDRETLAELTVPILEDLEAEGINRFHFHLSDNTSFLRVHNPDNYGDDLSDTRQTIVEANETQERVTGLEGGVTGAAFRSVVPVEYEGAHIGTVEISTSLHEGLLENYKEELEGEWYFYGFDEEGTSFDKIHSSAEDEIVELDSERLSYVRDGENISYDHDNYQISLRPLEDFEGENHWFLARVFDNTENIEYVQSQTMNNIIIGVIASLASILIMVMVFRKLLAPLKDVVSKLTHFEKGDLTVSFESDKVDETGVVANAVENARKNLVNLIYTINEKAEQVASSSEELSASTEENKSAADEVSKAIEDISESAMKQAEETEETSKRADELGELIENDQRRLENLNDQINEVDQLKEEGSKVLEDLNEKSKESDEATKEIRQVINETNESSKEIEKASEQVADIAEQTNLLALNASIEAARAGEHGEGFAVVADEIRKLAEQSNEHSDSISKIIRELAEKTDKAVSTMEKMSEIFNSQNQSITDTGEKFEGISGSIESTKQVISELNEASRAMMDKKGEIVKKVNDLAEIAENNSSATEESSASVEEQTAALDEIANASNSLAELAQEMQEEVQKFKY